MTAEKNYLDINRTSWNNRLETHLSSAFYDLQGFKQGRNSLTSIELDFLGDVQGKKILHLQCHFGQDTLSLARMGAETTGADLSDKAIEAARALSSELGLSAQFICSDLYSLPGQLDQTFDVVYTSFGTIGWLPDIEQWVKVIHHFLKPGGTFIFVDFHPVLWMFDDNFEKIIYSYFQRAAILEEEAGSYADRDAGFTTNTVTWNHSMSSVLNTLIENGFTIEKIKEYDSSPFNCFRNTEEISPGQFQISHLKDKLPMVYALRARR
jgi:ubiquinone/menaquinone biosynthesis C-methylase UbiE